MYSQNIVFRADAHDKIGTGDLTSLCELAYSFKEELWEPFFICRDTDMARKILCKHGFKAHFIPFDLSIKAEDELIKSQCLAQKAKALVYEITDGTFASFTLPQLNLLKVAINFDGQIPAGLDLLINWDVEAEGHYSASVISATQGLFGPQYVILPHRFLARPSPKEKSPTIRHLLITLGGVDFENYTLEVLSSLYTSRLPEELQIRLILGPGYPYQKELSQMIAARQWSPEIIVNTPDMLSHYTWADFVIGGGGLTASELAHLKIPALLIGSQKHQMKRLEYLAQHGYALNAGFRPQIQPCIWSQIEKFYVCYQPDLRQFGGNQGICRQIRELASLKGFQPEIQV